MSLPERPRLADHVLPRRHVIDGTEHVVLFDQQTGGVIRLGPREWGILQAADGTRDLEGIRLAAQRDGAHARPGAILELLRSLHDIGFVTGPRPTPQGPARVVIVDRSPRSLPLEPLPGYSPRCDRSGACCRIYATVLMTRAEAERARTLLPEHRVGPVEPSRFFLPVAGSEPSELVAPTSRDGACGFLDDEGGCAIHAVGGIEAKPAGCRLFPVIFVDDGTSVRVSVRPECACVIDGGLLPGDEPICDPAWRVASDLPAHVAVHRLAAELPVREQMSITPAQARAWIDAWLAISAPCDPAAGAWAMAGALERGTWDDALEAWATPSAPDPASIAPWMEALRARASRRAREDAGWRSERDEVRATTAWLAATTLVLTDREVLAELLAAPVPESPAEHVYLRAVAFGYSLFDRPLVTSLRDHAVRLWTARAMASLVPPADQMSPRYRRPIARLEAVLRAYGVRNYVDDLTTRT